MRYHPAMSGSLAFLLVLGAAAGCASAADPRNGGAQAPIPEVLAGVPGPILAARAVADLESLDPERVATGRRILRALPVESLDGWRQRAALEPEGAPGRLDYFAVLADRGEPLDGATTLEVVATCLREIARDGPEERATMLALEVLRPLGEEAARPLRIEAQGSGPGSLLARRLLRVLGLPERDVHGAVP